MRFFTFDQADAQPFRVEFRYRPPSVRLGLVLSATGLVLAFAASLGGSTRREGS